jgi:hypothetical protein
MDRLGYMAAACGRYPSAYWDNGSFQMLHSGRSRKPTMKKRFTCLVKNAHRRLGAATYQDRLMLQMELAFWLFLSIIRAGKSLYKS